MRPNTTHWLLKTTCPTFFYFILYIGKTNCMIYVILCKHTPNLASSINVIIAKNEYDKLI